MRHVPVWSAILLAVGVGAGIALVQRTAEPPTLSAGTVLPQPRELPAFALVDQAGRPFDGKRLEGRWSLLFTGFTHCPDVCPTTVALMADLNRRVAREDVQFVFVSVDPEGVTRPLLARPAGLVPVAVPAHGHHRHLRQCTRTVATTPAWSDGHSGGVLPRSVSPTTVAARGRTAPWVSTRSIRLRRADVGLSSLEAWQQVSPGSPGLTDHASVNHAFVRSA